MKRAAKKIAKPKPAKKGILERVADSDRNRAEMRGKFGFMPLSVLRIGRGPLHRSMFHLQGERGTQTSGGTHRAEIMGDMTYAHQRLKVSRAGSRQTSRKSEKHRAWSVMSAELVDFFCAYYAKKGDTYLDPFMGQGVQMQVAQRRGMHYVGMDICEEFYRYIRAVAEKIHDTTTNITPILGDSRFPTEIPDGIGDFSFHSPPYWDIEAYGPEAGQLGTGGGLGGESYEAFLDGLEDVARAWLPKFKRGAYHVVNVNDFRKSDRFYAYHADVIVRFCRAGWELVDTWIVEGVIAGLPKVFAASFNARKIAPKVHEYALVFRAP